MALPLKPTHRPVTTPPAGDCRSLLEATNDVLALFDASARLRWAGGRWLRDWDDRSNVGLADLIAPAAMASITDAMAATAADGQPRALCAAASDAFAARHHPAATTQPIQPHESRLNWQILPDADSGEQAPAVWLVGNAIDDQQRELADLQQRFTDSELRYRGLLRSLNDLLIVVDTDCIVREINPRAADRFGGSPQRWLDQPVERMFDTATVQLFRRRAARVIKSGQPSRWQGAVTLFGQPTYFDFILSPLSDADGVTRRVVALCRDMTDHVAAQQMLQEAEVRYRTVIDSVNDLIYVIDGEHRFLSLNSAMSAMLHAHAEAVATGSSGQLIGRKVADVLADDAWSRHHEQVRAVLETAAKSEFEDRLPLAGSSRVLNVVLSPVRHGGEVVAVVGVARDRTSQRNLEEAMYRAQKMETVGQLAGGVAHDFNNLLVGVLSNASFVRMQLKAGSPLLGPIDLIEKSAAQAAGLIQQMLAFGGRGNRQIQPVNLNGVVEDTVQLWQPQLADNVTVETQLNDRLPPLDGDRSQIGQIVMNLLINAAEAMPGGGRVTIATLLRDKADLIEAGATLRSDKALELCVSDTGHGMSEEVQRKVFEPYFTTKKDGRGLGLAAVYGIVRRHQGELIVRSQPGEGTTFRLFFPPSEVKESVREIAIPSESTLGRLPEGNAAILVLAESEPLEQQLETILSLMAYDVYLAGTLEEMEELLAERGSIHTVMAECASGRPAELIDAWGVSESAASKRWIAVALDEGGVIELRTQDRDWRIAEQDGAEQLGQTLHEIISRF